MGFFGETRNSSSRRTPSAEAAHRRAWNAGADRDRHGRSRVVPGPRTPKRYRGRST